MIAVGVLCTAAVMLAALFISSTGLMIAARHRSYAAMLARAKIEELLAAGDAGDVVVDGMDTVDGDGRVTAAGAGIYGRQWRLAPLASHPDRILLLTVEVTPRLPSALHAGRTELRAFVERRP
jgi:hypothetical protein